jgi:hypothetical protein
MKNQIVRTIQTVAIDLSPLRETTTRECQTHTMAAIKYGDVLGGNFLRGFEDVMGAPIQPGHVANVSTLL